MTASAGTLSAMEMNPNQTIYVSGGSLSWGTAAVTSTTASVQMFTEVRMPPFLHEGLHPVHEIRPTDPISVIWVQPRRRRDYPTARAMFEARK